MLIETIKLYEHREDVTLTTYVLAEKGEMKEQGKRPAVIICPGGAYMGCSDREAEPVALKFASMGYHAFVLRYSTYGEGKNEFPKFGEPLPRKEHCIHPAPVREIGKSMLLLREHEEQWQIDVEKIVICGFSAGAHNAAMYGVYWHTPLLTEYYHVDSKELKPAAVILGYALIDYVFMRSVVKEDTMGGTVFTTSNMAFLGEENPADKYLQEVSPCMHVTEHTPPMFLWATAADDSIPIQNSLRMAHALADKKIPFEMHIFEKGEHGLSVATQASAVAQTQLNEDVAKWMELAEAWMKKRFALGLPEKEELFGEN